MQRFGNFDLALTHLNEHYDVCATFDYRTLDWPNLHQVKKDLESAWRDSFQHNQRIVLIIDHDWYQPNSESGDFLEILVTAINKIDISNFFVVCVSSNPAADIEYQTIHQSVSTDATPWTIIQVADCWQKREITTASHKNFSTWYTTTDTNELIDKYKTLLNGPNFCMAPWTHSFIGTNGNVHLCCISDTVIGNIKHQSWSELWNNEVVCSTRLAMLRQMPSEHCSQCVNNEVLGKESYRQYINRRLSHRIQKIETTDANGRLASDERNYIHFKFSNNCNLSCRSCLPANSSSWVPVAKSTAIYPVLNQSVKTKFDDGQMLTRLKSDLSQIDLIKFTGGEPLIMDEFYDLLQHCAESGRTDIELYYNTNFTTLTHKGRNILDLWKQFPNISVGISLDGEADRDEYLRPGTRWTQIQHNILQLRRSCPHVVWHVASTASILNAHHLPDFHRSWCNQGVIQPWQFDISILVNPQWLRIHAMPEPLRAACIEKYRSHLAWLQSRDSLGRAFTAFKAVLECLTAPGETFNAVQFRNNSQKLDQYHKTTLTDTFPELAVLYA